MDIKKLLIPERTQLRLRKETYHNYQSEEIKYENIIDRGLVLAIDYYGNKEFGVTQYSIKVKLEKGFNTFDNDKFYPPLLPIHSLSLPQVGEEVWMIFVTAGNKSMGFWISRVNYTNSFSLNSFKNVDLSKIYNTPDLKEIQNDEIFGIGNDVSKLIEKFDVEPNNDYKTPTIRIKPGDTVSHGRSNTHLIHTFDTKNKNGVLDLITEIEESKKQFYEQEFNLSNGARLLLVTKNNLDNLIIKEDLNKKFHEKFKMIGNDESFALLQSDNIRLISKNGTDVNHALLGEKYIDWMDELLLILKLYIDKVSDYIDIVTDSFDKTLTNAIINHGHLTPIGPTAPTVMIPANVTTQNINIATNLNDIKQQILEIKTNLDNQFKKIEETKSKNIALN